MPINNYSPDSLSHLHVPPSDPARTVPPTPTVSSSRGWIERAGFWFFVAGVVLSLIIASPVAWIPSTFLKVALSVTCVAFSSALFFTWRFMHRNDASASSLFSGGIAGATVALSVPFAYLVALIFSTDKTVAFLGVGNETDTVFFALAAFLTLMYASFFVRSLSRVHLLISGLVVAILAAVGLQYIGMFLPSLFPSALISQNVTFFIGRLDELSLAAALASLLLIVRLEFMPGGRFRIGSYIGIVLSAFLLLLINFVWAWGLLLFGLFGVVVLKALSARGGAVTYGRRAMWAYVLGAIALVFFAWGMISPSKEAEVLNKVLPSSIVLNYPELRPSFGPTYAIARAAHEGSAMRLFFGTGPNTFGEQWLQHKPLIANETPFWNVDFTSGFSSVMTAFVSLGLLGVLAWLLPLLLLLVSFPAISRRLSRGAAPEAVALLSLWLAATFLWLIPLIYIPGQALLLLAFAVLGAYLGFGESLREKVLAEGGVHQYQANRSIKLFGLAVLLALFVLSSCLAILGVRRTLSVSYEERALFALRNGDINAAAVYDFRSEQFEITGENLRTGVEIGMAHMSRVLSATSTQENADSLRTSFQNAIATAILQGEEAQKLNPQDYRADVELARVYEFAYTLGIDGAYDAASKAYTSAMQKNPTNPALPLLLARLQATQDLSGNIDSVQQNLKRSITLKRNYTDAFLLAEQIAVAKKDLPSAIEAAKAVVDSVPSDASLWFQLGLYYYAGGDMTNAIKTFEKAVALVPEYANAKYFLGLAYAKANRMNDALAQFQQLQQTNADNAELKSIIADLQAGKVPFSGKNTAADPAKRAQAPLKD